MKLKYYLRGAGIGIIFATLVMIVSCFMHNYNLSDEYIIKEGIDNKGMELAQKEQDWYSKADAFGFENIPKVYEINPLKLERIKGKNIYEYDDISYSQKESRRAS